MNDIHQYVKTQPRFGILSCSATATSYNWHCFLEDLLKSGLVQLCQCGTVLMSYCKNDLHK